MAEHTPADWVSGAVDMIVVFGSVNGTSGRPLAEEFEQRYPEAANRLFPERRTKSSTRSDRTPVVELRSGNSPKYAIYLAAQPRLPGPQEDLRALAEQLEELATVVQRKGIASVGIPTFRGEWNGLTWRPVAGMITAALARTPEVRVIVYAHDVATRPASVD